MTSLHQLRKNFLGNLSQENFYLHLQMAFPPRLWNNLYLPHGYIINLLCVNGHYSFLYLTKCFISWKLNYLNATNRWPESPVALTLPWNLLFEFLRWAWGGSKSALWTLGCHSCCSRQAIFKLIQLFWTLGGKGCKAILYRKFHRFCILCRKLKLWTSHMDHCGWSLF